MKTTITPEMAEELLKHNTSNRNLRERLVACIARDIKNGNWHFNGATIVISDDGRLIDGQHRLEAIKRSGLSVEAIIIEGVSYDNAMPTVDSGAPRKPSDVLKLGGYKHACELASAVRLVLGYERTDNKSEFDGRVESRISGSDVLHYCNTQISEQFLNDFYSIVARKREAKLFSVDFFCFMLLYKANKEKCMEFFTKTLDGLFVDPHDPCKKYRDLSLSGGINTKGVRDAEFTKRKLKIVINLWNKFMRGEKVVAITTPRITPIPVSEQKTQ